MPRWLPSIPYPPSRTGYWSPVTSTLNWCEEEYYATQYAAEIVNTVTNFAFIHLGIKGIRNCLKEKHDTVFLVTFIGYLLVGIGSFLFHSTLKYPMQLLDELSMIYSTCISFFSVFSYSQSDKYRYRLAGALTALCAFITGYYHFLQEPLFHQFMYGLLTALVLLRSLYLMEVTLRPCMGSNRYRLTNVKIDLEPVSDEEQKRREKRDQAILNTMWKMVFFGFGSFFSGFVLWNLDNMLCSTLVEWRRSIGLPWGVLLEGHGWWHILTGYGAYVYIVWGIWMRSCLNGEQDNHELHWPSVLTSAPEVRKKNHKKT